MQKKTQLAFPKRFLWGASTSAHAVEGNTHNQWTVWELENAKTKAAQAKFQLEDLDSWARVQAEAEDPASYVSGEASDHYVHYEEDFDLLRKMNLNALRFGVEWSRVEPAQGAWSVEAVEHYKRYVAQLRRRGIEPVVTLFHNTLPVWFTAMGGFEKRQNVQYFVQFAERMIRELGRDVRFVITMNEPEVYAYESYYKGNWPPQMTSKWQFWRVLSNLAYAHNQTAKAIHALNRRYKTSIAKNSVYFYPGDDAWLSRRTAEVMQYAQDDYFLKKVIKQCDFLGVTFYHSARVYGYRVHNPEKQVDDMGRDLSPADIQYALERVYRKYGLPIIVTENGLADGEDTQRQWWLTQTLAGMQRAMEAGVRLEGYVHGCLLDGFVWDRGRWPRFGLIAVDYKTQKRRLRPSAAWLGKVIKHLRKGD